jgi:hypothetical protein
VAGDRRVLPVCRGAVDRDVFRTPNDAGCERRAASLAARGAVAQANPDRLASRLDPDGAAVAARGTDRHVDLHTGTIPFPTDQEYSDTSRRPHQLGPLPEET